MSPLDSSSTTYADLADSLHHAKSQSPFVAKYVNQQILPHIEAMTSKPLLDIGCGYGKYLTQLKAKGFKATSGIDICPRQVEIAQQIYGLDNVIVGDPIEHLSESNETFGVILMIDIVEHLEMDYLINLLATAFERLQTNGKIVIQTPNALCPLSPFCYADVTHLRAFTPNSLQQLCRAAGTSPPQFYPLPPLAKGVLSRIRRLIWKAAINPLIQAYTLIATGSSMGGIHTPNILAVIEKP